jgi:RimJ/RimL family protein N-acetyltransferase
MSFNLQPQLEDQQIKLRPLRADDFVALYAAASDPLIWEQHPSRNRFERDAFGTYFEGAMESGGAFLVSDAQTGQVIGSSRYYDLDENQHTIAIGYTFITRPYWGRGYNRRLKTLMLDHAFQYVEQVDFHVGASNMRSRKAMEKLGGKLIGETAMSYYGEPVRPNVIYRIAKADWLVLREAG